MSLLFRYAAGLLLKFALVIFIGAVGGFLLVLFFGSLFR